MKYIADALSFLRLCLALVIIFCIIKKLWLVALVLFIVAVASDAIDGICARKWPKEQKGIINPQLIDNIPDALLAFLSVTALAIHHNTWLIALVVILLGNIVIQAAMFSLHKQGNNLLAGRINVVFMLLGVLLQVIIGWQLASNGGITTWYIGTVLAITPFVVFIKRNKFDEWHVK